MGQGRVAVVCGGGSAEREVSLRSGSAVCEALRGRGPDVELWDWHPGRAGALLAWAPDVAVLALHGGVGENGSVQGFFESVEIPYTGSGVLASAIAMDKLRSKEVFAWSGVPSPAWVALEGEAASEVPPLSPPFALKPASEGSSVGVQHVESAAGWSACRTDLRGRWLAEAWIEGRELTVGFLGEQVLGVCEIRVASGFYDYAAKYERADTAYLVPAPLADAEALAVRDAAAAAWRALGCRGVGRVDVLLDGAGAWVLEANTLPGMTSTSLVPKLAAAQGIDFAALAWWMVSNACTDAGKRSRWWGGTT